MRVIVMSQKRYVKDYMVCSNARNQIFVRYNLQS